MHKTFVSLPQYSALTKGVPRYLNNSRPDCLAILLPNIDFLDIGYSANTVEKRLMKQRKTTVPIPHNLRGYV